MDNTIYSVLLIAFSVLLVLLVGCAVTGQDIAKESYEDSQIHIYEVFGMDCPACASGLDKLVKKIPGVIESEANWEEKRLVVIVRPGIQLNDDDVFDAVKRANFTPGKRIK